MSKKLVNYRLSNQICETIDKFCKEKQIKKTKMIEVAIKEFFKRRDYELVYDESEVIV